MKNLTGLSLILIMVATPVLAQGDWRNRDRDRDRDRGYDRDRPAFSGDPRKAAGEACYNVVLGEAQRRNPTASNFKIFLSQNRYAQQSNVEIRVTGVGELRHMDRRREQFGYSCIFNARNGRVGDIRFDR